MVNAKGTVSVEYKGGTLTLELNFGVLADLEAEFGEDFDMFINGRKNPTVSFIVRTVEASLVEGEPDIEQEKAKLIARKITSTDLFADLMKGAFPDAKVESEPQGNGKRPKRAA